MLTKIVVMFKPFLKLFISFWILSLYFVYIFYNILITVLLIRFDFENYSSLINNNYPILNFEKNLIPKILCIANLCKDITQI